MRKQPTRLIWPLTPSQVESVDEMFYELYRRVGELSAGTSTGTASTSGVTPIATVIGASFLAGPDGDDGAPGPPGRDGELGIAGVRGADGMSGDDGADGWPGPQGNAGSPLPRLQTLVSSATVTPTPDNADIVVVTAQAVALFFANPTPVVTVVQGQRLVIRIKDNGTARAITYDTQYRAVGGTLPTTTVLNKTLYLYFFYNSTDTKWDVILTAQEA